MQILLLLGVDPMPGATSAHPGGMTGSATRFPVTCSNDAQAVFDEGMTLEHMFSHEAAAEKFALAFRHDPGCAMAYWGMALAALDNLFLTPAPNVVDKSRALLLQAEVLPTKSAREAEYIAALRALLGDGIGDGKWENRTGSFASAMEQVASRYPDDVEAQILYALALVMSAPSGDTAYTSQRKAAGILEALFLAHPSHPGVAHYLIHAYDTPLDAAKGVAAARRFAQMAHDSPHALHMPSHIFTRLGLWDESISSNLRSAQAARAADAPNDELHARDYLVYAYLQTGRDKAAEAAHDASRIPEARLNDAVLGGPFAVAAMEARLALESGDWQRATALRIVRFDGFPQVEALVRIGRALGAARSARPADSRPELARLAVLEEVLGAGDNRYWQEQVRIQFLAANAWFDFAEGRRPEALTQMRVAAELEAHTNKSVVTPGPLAPARELLGEMLMDANRPGDAQAEFEQALKVEPNRFRSVYGAARAAELSGDLGSAMKRYSDLLRIAAGADTNRPELQQARAFVAGHPP